MGRLKDFLAPLFIYLNPPNPSRHQKDSCLTPYESDQLGLKFVLRKFKGQIDMRRERENPPGSAGHHISGRIFG